jgi:hypothetical protein
MTKKRKRGCPSRRMDGRRHRVSLPGAVEKKSEKERVGRTADENLASLERRRREQQARAGTDGSGRAMEQDDDDEEEEEGVPGDTESAFLVPSRRSPRRRE